MPKKDRHADILEWTIHDDLKPGEELPPLAGDHPQTAAGEPAPAPATRPQRDRRPWLVLAAVAGLVALGPWLYQRWQWGQAESGVAEIVSLQDAAGPAPLAGLTAPEGDIPRLHALTQLNQDVFRADVARRFLAPDGRAASFSLPRFFRRMDEAWQPLETPPPDFPGEVRVKSGKRWQITYYAADAGLIEDNLAPYLADILEQACQTVPCAADTQVHLDFVNPPGSAAVVAGAWEAAAGDPWLFTLFATDAGNERWLRDVMRAAAPHRAGIPVDAAALDLWQRSLGLRALVNLTWRSLGQPPLEDGMLLALTARLAARLGLEAPATSEYALVDQEALKHYFESGGGSVGRDARPAARIALASLNTLLRGQPAAVEARLWQAMADAPGNDWPPILRLAPALRAAGMTADDFFGRLRSVFGEAGPAPSVAPAAVDLALVCQPAPQLYGRDGLQPLAAVSSMPAYTWLLNWSPDGERLALTTYLQTTVVELATGRIAWPPLTGDRTLIAMFGLWLSPTTLAYNEFPLTMLADDQLNLSTVRLKLWEAGQAAAAEGPAGVIAIPDWIRVAPDGRHLALLRLTDEGPQSPGELAIMSVAGGELETVATDAFLPTWSPDGRSLAFLHRDATAGGISLHLWEVGARTFTRLWNSQATADQLPARMQANYNLAWSPDGRWLAFAGQDYSAATGWLALLSLEDDHLRIVGTRSVATRNLGFSADSSWLAGVVEGPPYNAVAIYDVRTGQEVRRLAEDDVNWEQPLWSPRDGRLLAFRNSRPYLLPEARGRAVALGEVNCTSAAWRP